jgi:hypothetical protein
VPSRHPRVLLVVQRVYLCDKRAVDHDQVLIRPSRSMFALLPAPSLLHFGEMRFEALLAAPGR